MGQMRRKRLITRELFVPAFVPKISAWDRSRFVGQKICPTKTVKTVERLSIGVSGRPVRKPKQEQLNKVNTLNKNEHREHER